MTNPLPAGLGVRPFPGETAVSRWRPQPWSALAADIARAGRTDEVRPVIVGIDGRSGSGKTTVATRVAQEVEGAVVVHTDDVAWWESFFGWDGLLAAGVLVPARQGGSVRFRPPAWERRGRDGAIEVPAGCPLLLVEGVGVTRVGLSSLLDLTVWVQSDAQEARRRGLARDAHAQESTDERDRPDASAAEEFWEEWQQHEVPFLATDRPWDRARITVCGTPELVHPEHIEPPLPPEEAAGFHPARHVLRAVRVAGGGPDEACRC